MCSCLSSTISRCTFHMLLHTYSVFVSSLVHSLIRRTMRDPRQRFPGENRQNRRKEEKWKKKKLNRWSHGSTAWKLRTERRRCTEIATIGVERRKKKEGKMNRTKNSAQFERWIYELEMANGKRTHTDKICANNSRVTEIWRSSNFESKQLNVYIFAAACFCWPKLEAVNIWSIFRASSNNIILSLTFFHRTVRTLAVLFPDKGALDKHEHELCM